MATVTQSMRKLLNDPEQVVTESLAGLAAAHGDILRVEPPPRSSCAPTRRAQGKVALVSGGGSGHEPLHGGFVGLGMLDAACPGEVFTSPVPDQMLAATHAVDGGAGVVHLVKNYTGDVMNFKLAAEDAADDGIEVASVLIDDDVAVQDSLYTAGRRGVGATVLAEKIAGAAAERGDDLARWPASPAASTSARARSASRSPRASRRPPASRSSTCRRARWRSASASTASPAGGASRSGRPRRSPRDGRGGAQRPRARRRPELLVFTNSMGGTPQLELYLLHGEIERGLRASAASAGAERLVGQLHHVARDGRRVADGAGARRRARGAVGCSGPHRRPPLGGLSWSVVDRAWTPSPSPPGWHEPPRRSRRSGPPDAARLRDRRRRPRRQPDTWVPRRRPTRSPARPARRPGVS